MLKLIGRKIGIISLILGFLILDQLGLLTVAIFAQYNVLDQSIYFYTAFIITLVSLFVFLLYANKNHLLEWKTALKSPYFKVVLLGWLALRIPNILGGLILLLEQTDTVRNQEVLTTLLQQLPSSFMFLEVAIAAPIMEEIIFRHIIPLVLFEKHHKLGFVVGSLAFGLIHGPTNIGSFVIYVGMGAILSYIYYRYRRLEYTISIHLLNNLLAFLMILLISR